MKRVLFFLMALLFAGTAVFANGGKDSENGKDTELQIGAIYLDAQGYYAGVRAGVQNRAAEIGKEVNVIETNARGDVAKESSFINTLSVAGIDALIMSPVSMDGSARAVKRAAEAGIPVILYNTGINKETMESSVYAYAVGDPFEFGRKIGFAAADYMKENDIKSPQIGVVNCEQYEVCITRREGFESALNEADVDDWEIVANQQGTELDEAMSTAEQILSANPSVQILFGESGGASLGAVRAVRNLNRIGKVVVFGSDMTTEIAEELKSHEVLKGIVGISGKATGALALDLAIDAINGATVESQKVPVPIDLYLSTEDAENWLETHADGLP